MANKPTPDGYHTVTPYLVATRADKLIDFLRQAFNAEETQSQAQPDGTIMHAEVRIGDSIIMLSDAVGESEPMPAWIHLYVNDTNATYNRALQAGATSIIEPADQFYGDRMAGVKDAFGNTWWIATHIEDVSPEEMKKRAEDFMKQKSEG